MSQLYVHEHLVRIQQPFHKILCRQVGVPPPILMPIQMPTLTGSTPKSVCPPPFMWDDIKNWNSLNKFWGFQSLHYSHIYGKNAPPIGGYVFQQNNMSWRNLIESHPKNTHVKFHWNLLNRFWEDFQSLHYSHIRQECPTHWWPCFQWINMNGRKLVVTQRTFL